MNAETNEVNSLAVRLSRSRISAPPISVEMENQSSLDQKTLIRRSGTAVTGPSIQLKLSTEINRIRKFHMDRSPRAVFNKVAQTWIDTETEYIQQRLTIELEAMKKADDLEEVPAWVFNPNVEYTIATHALPAVLCKASERFKRLLESFIEDLGFETYRVEMVEVGRAYGLNCGSEGGMYFVIFISFLLDEGDVHGHGGYRELFTAE